MQVVYIFIAEITNIERILIETLSYRCNLNYEILLLLNLIIQNTLLQGTYFYEINFYYKE